MGCLLFLCRYGFVLVDSIIGWLTSTPARLSWLGDIMEIPRKGFGIFQGLLLRQVQQKPVRVM